MAGEKMIRIGILGYGNLGRGIECAIKHTKDMKLVAVFTRRDPSSVKILTSDAKVENIEEVLQTYLSKPLSMRSTSMLLTALILMQIFLSILKE